MLALALGILLTLALLYAGKLARMAHTLRVLLKFNELQPRTLAHGVSIEGAREAFIVRDFAGAVSRLRGAAWVVRDDAVLAAELRELAEDLRG